MQDFPALQQQTQQTTKMFRRGCCPQSRCPKTSHHHAFTLWRNMAELLQAWFPITWQLLIIQILSIASTPVKDVLQVKRPRCLVTIWNVSPWKCLSPTVSNKTDFTFARHLIYFFILLFGCIPFIIWYVLQRSIFYHLFKKNNKCGTAIQWKYIFFINIVCVYFPV